MKLNNPALYLYLTTVPLVGKGGQKLLPELGTGFFIDFVIQAGCTTRWLITNKHVVEGAAQASLRLHAGVKDKNGVVTVSQESFDLVVQNPSAITIFHPNEDLCALSGAELAKGVDVHKKVLAAESFSEGMISSEADLEGLGAIQEVIMVGYPASVKDDANNLPIIRRGVTGSHPGIRFNGECRGIVDMASFGGSSGSPVLVWSENFVLKNGQPCEEKRRFLLGINVDRQEYEQDAPVQINCAPTNPAAIAKVRVPLHLGKYIRAEALLGLKDEILKQGKFL